jgi:hypothetical protein
MGQTVYLIYEKAADSLNDGGHETRVYLDENSAKEHVAENHDPTLERWMVEQKSADPTPADDGEFL